MARKQKAVGSDHTTTAPAVATPVSVARDPSNRGQLRTRDTSDLAAQSPHELGKPLILDTTLLGQIECVSSMKPIHFSVHASFEMQRRGISRADVEVVVRNPGQVVPSKNGRQIHQSKIGAAGQKLLRVIVKEDALSYYVITVYKTVKVAKYWKQP
jgi:hypothetical protein